MPFVYSTLTCDNVYNTYENKGNSLPIITKSVLIKGGSNVINKLLITPKGVATQVTDEEMTHLENNPVFQQHVQNGFIRVERKEVDIDKIVKDMVKRDASAPRTPADYPEGEAPVVNTISPVM